MLTFKRLWRLMPNNKLLYIGALIATGLATVFSLLSPLVVRFTIDNVINGATFDAPGIVNIAIASIGGIPMIAGNLWICFLAVVFLTIIQGSFSYLKGKWTAIASENIAKTIKDNLYDHLQKLPYDYHVKAQTGDLIQRCTSDVETIRRFLAAHVIEIGRTVFIVIFSISFMLSLSVRLTLVSLIIIPVIFISSFIFFNKVRRVFLLVDEKEGELSTVLQENLSGVRVVRAFGREQFETEKYETKNVEFRDLCRRLLWILSIFWSLSDLFCLTQMGLVLFYGIYLTVHDQISLGTLLVFTTYEGMLIWPLRNLGRLLADMGKMGVSLERVYEVLNSPIEQDTPNAIRPSLKGDIVFSNVLFGYEKNKPILKDMDFRINCGETVAVLGTTGSGKSTLMHILLRLYDYNSGSIKINQTELRSIEKKWLREKIGIVLQEPFLYSKTIKENIKMAKDNVNEQEVIESTKIASVHDVIEGFENGYNTIVGEKGVTLSGGQKQRVAIARTLIKNCDILIFDDSLSAVDTETDSQIRAALKERQQDVTTIIISQRITTLKEADKIFVMEEGKVTDIGTHDELVNKEGLYSRIWKIQTLLEDDYDDEVGK